MAKKKNNNSIGSFLKDYIKIQDQITAKNAEIRLLKEKEKNLEEELILKGREEGLTELGCKEGKRFISTKKVPTIKKGGWPKLLDFLIKKKRKDIIKQGLKSKEFSDFAEEVGIDNIPEVDFFEIQKLTKTNRS